MAEKPLISIITCFLNEEQFLEDAVESVLHQDYPSWELFLIDDGSTDKSTETAKKYVKQYPNNIFYGEHEGHANRGLSASRNLALKLARGNFIALLDADDYWYPRFLTGLSQIMQQNPVSLVCEASEYWYNWGDPKKTNKVVMIGTENNRIYTPSNLLLNLYPLALGSAPCPCAMLLRKDRLIALGGFKESFSVYEDQVFLSKFYLNEAVYISSNCNNKYRIREGSLVSTSHTNGIYHQERKRFLEWLEQYLIKTGNVDLTIMKTLRSASFPYRYPILHGILNKLPEKIAHFIRAAL